MTAKKLKLHYRFSLFWPIFWGIFFFPIALVLIFTGSDFLQGDKIYRFRYDGSRFWLCFWTLLFFPIAFILFFLNGFSIEIREPYLDSFKVH